MAQDGKPTYTVWTEQPEWDEKHLFWYWRGRRRQDDGRMKPIRRPLKPHELGYEGCPVIGLEPPPEVGGESELSSSIPRPSDSQSLQNLSDRDSSQQSVPFTIPIGSPRSEPSPQSSPGNYTTATGSPLQFQSFPGHGQDTVWSLDTIQEESATLNDSAGLQSFSPPGAVPIYQDAALQTGHQQDWSSNENPAFYYQTSAPGSYSSRGDQNYHPASSHGGRRHRDKGHSRKSSERGETESQRQGNDYQSFQSGSGQAGGGDDYRPRPGGGGGGAFGSGSAWAALSGSGPYTSRNESYQSTAPYAGTDRNSTAAWAQPQASFNTGESSFAKPAIPAIPLSRKAVKAAPKTTQKNYNGRLDSNYYIHPSSDFQPGKIVSIMWAEPQGSFKSAKKPQGPSGSRLSNYTLLEDHKKDFWTGFRRFIIVLNHEGHCTGVPIYSYQGQGCNKHGVKHSQHGVIYEEGNTATLVPGERPLGFAPVRARTTYGTPFNNVSRVNYSKLVTLPHNREVSFIADVNRDDWDDVKHAVRSFWSH